MEIEHQLNVLPSQNKNNSFKNIQLNISNNTQQNINNSINLNNVIQDNINQNNLSENKEEKKKRYSKLLRIRERIDKLSKEGKIEIFKIIHKNNEKFSKNNNGVMFDIKVIKQETIEEITNFLNFSDINQKNFDLEEMKRNDYRLNCN